MHKVPLPVDSGTALVHHLLQLECAQSGESSVAFLLTLADDYSAVLLAAVLARLDHFIQAEPLTAVVLLSLIKTLFARSRVARALVNTPSGARLLQAVRTAVESESERLRSAAYLVLQCLISGNDRPSVLFALQSETWDRVMQDVSGGNDQVSNGLRDNALISLVFLVRCARSNQTAIPWTRVIDCVKVILSGSSTTVHRSLACQLLHHALSSESTLASAMLSQDVAEHAFEALRLHGPSDESAPRLLQLVTQLASLEPKIFPAHASFGVAVLADTIGWFCSTQADELVSTGLTALAVLFAFEALSQDEFICATAGKALCSTSNAIWIASASELVIAWLQLAHYFLAAPMEAVLASSVQEACFSVLGAISGCDNPSAHIVALGASLCSHFPEACQVFDEIVRAHELLIVSNVGLFLEILKSPHLTGAMFPLVMEAYFSARRRLKTSDPVLLSLCESVLDYATQLLPWWGSRIVRAQASLLRLPEPALWLETMSEQHDASITSLVTGMTCCALKAGFNPLSDEAPRLLLQAIQSRPELATLEMAVVLCMLGWNDNSTPTASLLARAVLAANPYQFDVSFPTEFVRWTFTMRSLDDLTLGFVRAMIQSNTLGTIPSMNSLLVGHLVRLIAAPSTDDIGIVLVSVHQMICGGGDLALIFVAKGLLSALTTLAQGNAEFVVPKFSVICQVVMALLGSGSVEPRVCVEIIVQLGEFVRIIARSDDSSALLSWFNVANLVFSQTSNVEQVKLVPEWALSFSLNQAHDGGLIAAQLQLAGMRVSEWNATLFDQCSQCFLDITLSQSPAVVSASLFVMRRMLQNCSGELMSSSDFVHDKWVTLLSLLLSPHETARAAAAQCCTALIHGTTAELRIWLVQLPWTNYAWRCISEKVCLQSVPSSRIPSSHLVFLLTVMQSGCRYNYPGASLMSRLVSGALHTSEPEDAVLLELIWTAISHDCIGDSEKGPIQRMVRTKISATVASSATSQGSQEDSNQEPHCCQQSFELVENALLLPHLLWDVSANVGTRRAREDRLFKIHEKINHQESQ